MLWQVSMLFVLRCLPSASLEQRRKRTGPSQTNGAAVSRAPRFRDRLILIERWRIVGIEAVPDRLQMATQEAAEPERRPVARVAVQPPQDGLGLGGGGTHDPSRRAHFEPLAHVHCDKEGRSLANGRDEHVQIHGREQVQICEPPAAYP